MKSNSNFQKLDTASAVKMVLEELCQSHYGSRDDALNKKIEALWFKLRGTPMMERSTTAMAFRGFPGQGKTTAYHVACDHFAKACGLNFVVDPSDDDIKELLNTNTLKDSFLFIKHEMAGEMSNASFGGIPSKETVDGMDYMTKLPPLKLAVLKDASAGMLLLDDFNNAGASVQNIALSLLEEKRYQSLKLGNIYVGLTGNLGALDGTNVAGMSAANATRVQSYEVSDSPEAWAARSQARYNDEVGEALLSSFFSKFGDANGSGHQLFHKPSSKKDGSPYPCSREWTKALQYMRQYYFEARHHIAGGNDASFLLKDLERTAAGHLGMEAGTALKSFYYNVFNGAMPMAIAQMESGSMPDILKEKLISANTNNSNTSDGAYLANQYISALSDEAVFKLSAAIKADEDIGPILNNFVDGVYNYGLHPGLIAQANAQLKDKMIIKEKTRGMFGSINRSGLTVLNESIKDAWAKAVGGNAIAKQPLPDEPNRKLYEDTFQDVVSNAVNATSAFDEEFGQSEHMALLELEKDLKEIAEQNAALNVANSKSGNNVVTLSESNENAKESNVNKVQDHADLEDDNFNHGSFKL